MRYLALAFSLVLAGGACATTGTPAGDQSATGTSTRARTNVISLQEIRDSRAPSLYDMVRQLRPGWPSSQVVVFVNNDPFGDINSLRNLSGNNTAEIRLLSRSEVQIQWGSRYSTEVIQVITR
jgi:hypothetical protein